MSLLINKDVKKLFILLTSVLFLAVILVQVITYINTQTFKNQIIAHDYELAGYLRTEHPELELAIPGVFSSEKSKNHLEAGMALLEQSGYKKSINLHLIPRVNKYYETSTITNLLFSMLLSFVILFIVYLFVKSHYRTIDGYKEAIGKIMNGEISTRLDDNEEGSLPKLANYINIMTTSLHTHIEREKQSRVFLKDMITNISHQLKTPLAALMMYTEIMKDEINGNNAVQNFLNKSEVELSRMQILIANLLKLARFDAGIIELNRNDCILNDIIEQVAEGFETRVVKEDKNLEIFAEGEVSYFCDQEWLREALSNLLKNALEHTIKGNYIKVSLEKTPVMVKITVEDNGTGIHLDDINYIFKRFYRSRFSQDKQGTGIGLTLAKTIIEMHDGFISVDSAFGKGTRFTIHLPSLQKCKL